MCLRVCGFFLVSVSVVGIGQAVPEVDATGATGPDGNPVPRKDRLLAHIEAQYRAASADGAKRDGFERGITRAFFTPKPLTEDQLANWRSYLAFEQAQPDNAVSGLRAGLAWNHVPPCRCEWPACRACMEPCAAVPL